jgi:hypothetical protein
MISNNVVIFPKGKKDSLAQTMEEVMGSVLSSRVALIEYLTEEIMSFIIGRSFEEGIDLEDDSCMKMKIMLYEVVQGSLFKAIGIEHFTQEIADDLIEIESDMNDHS